jgi:hypothetical protein
LPPDEQEKEVGMDYRKLILERLLDKYEKSKAFTDETSKRRILIKLGSNEFPEYDIEKPIVRETFNSVIMELSSRELVGFEWLKHEDGNIIDRIWLIVPNANKAYGEISRKPKRSILDNVLERAEKAARFIGTDITEDHADGPVSGSVYESGDRTASDCVSASGDLSDRYNIAWAKNFLNDVISSIKDRASTAGLLPENEEQSLAVIRAIEELCKMYGTECLERVFSLRCYGDSKYFEKLVRGRLVGILKKYCVGTDESAEMTDDDILSQVGIQQSPEYVEFRGGISIRLDGNRIDFSSFPYGACINADTVRRLEVESMGTVKRILFIENKANYLDFSASNNETDLMIVYLGGFYSPVKGIFIKKVYEKASAQDVRFCHWSDIDLGGFLIFRRLKTDIIAELEPYLMDRAALESMREHAVSFDDKYAAKLEKLLAEDDLQVFRDVILYMLENRIRLEQEAFLMMDRHSVS